MLNNFIHHKLFLSNPSGGGSFNPNTGNEVLNRVINIGLPLLIFIFLVATSFHYIRLIQKGRLDLHETITWMIWNIVLMIIAIYLMIIYILQSAGFSPLNFLNSIGSWLGIGKGTQQWLTMIIIIFIGFFYAKTFSHAIKISKLRSENEILAREISILKGKFESTIKFLPVDDEYKGLNHRLQEPAHVDELEQSQAEKTTLIKVARGEKPKKSISLKKSNK